MLAQADFQRALALALGELAPAWTIVGDCSPVDQLDANHWGSGPHSFQVTLRHRVTGDLKFLGHRVAGEPTASVHPAVALSLIGAYRHGNPEPLRRYLEEIGVAAATPAASEPSHFFHRRPIALARADAIPEPAARVAASLTATSSAAPKAKSAVGSDEEGESDLDGTSRRASKRWSLSIRKTKSPALPAPVSRDVTPQRVPAPSTVVRGTPPIQPRKPKVGRLRRELEIWYWRRGASGLDKSHARD
jgi:hypothetical protein